MKQFKGGFFLYVQPCVKMLLLMPLCSKKCTAGCSNSAATVGACVEAESSAKIRHAHASWWLPLKAAVVQSAVG